MPRRRGPVLLLALLVVGLLSAFVVWAVREEPAPAPPVREGTVAPPVAPKAPARPAPAERRISSEVRRPERMTELDAEPLPADAPTVALRRAVKVVVTVLHPGGAPAADAEVLALDPLARIFSPGASPLRATKRTGADGRAELEIRGGTTALQLLATSPGEAGVSATVDLAAADEHAVTVQMTAGEVARVRVVDADGLAVTGAWARLRVSLARAAESVQWPIELTASADAEGLVTFPALPAGRVFARAHLAAGAKSYATESVAASWHVLLGEPVAIALERGVAVRGRVVDESGAPLAAAEVAIVGQQVPATSGPDGRFEADGLPPTGGALLVARDGYAPSIVRDLRGDAGDVDVGDVVLRRGDRVTGIVVAADGAPVAGAEVRARVADVRLPLGETRTGPDGRFVLERLPPEPLVVEADDGSPLATRVSAAVADVRPGAGDVRIVLTPAASVHVRFLDDADGKPVVVSSVKLTASSPAGSAAPAGAAPEPLGWVWSGRDIDAVRFRPDAVGVFDVTVEVPGYEPGVARAVEVAADRETRIDVRFRRR